MKFGKIIIQSVKSALYKIKRLLRFLCKRKRLPIVKANPENSEDQNPQNSLPEESPKTKDKSSKDDKEPDPNSSLPTQPDPSKETASPPKQSQKSQTQVPAEETPELSSQNASDSSESSGDTKDAIPETQLDSSKEETMSSDPSPLLPSPENPEPQLESRQDKDLQKQYEPVKAPGKRSKDKPKNQIAENGNRATKPQPPRYRFICYEDNRGWAVALAVEAGQEVQSVRQGNNELSTKDCRYILEDIGAKVAVKFKDGHSSKTFQLLEKHKFAVFKMRKNWQGKGQKVKTLSSGDYVVLAHKSCGERIGKPPIEAERCRYDDFTAHFFSVSEDSERDGFENCSLPFSRFSLSGQRFPDDSDLGELFGDEAPQLVDAEEWRKISWIVVGRENGGKVPDKFRPEEKKTIAEVLGERSGWFFVRIYDANANKLDSLHFRRAKGLNNILVNEQPLGKVSPIVPTKNGHTKTIVQFKGDSPVRPADNSNGICKVTENTFAVLPHPDNDWTKWILGSGEDCVESEILLPRIWWKFIEGKGKEGDWQDTPIERKREAFSPSGERENSNSFLVSHSRDCRWL